MAGNKGHQVKHHEGRGGLAGPQGVGSGGFAGK